MTSAALGQAILAAHLAVIVFNVAGLAAIPLGARIIAVAKDFDVSQIGKPAKQSLSLDAARYHMVQGRGNI